MEARRKAHELYSDCFDVNECIMQNKVSTDLDVILKRLGIKLFSVDMRELFPDTPNPEYDVSACITKEHDAFVIYVNQQESLVRRRFSVAHEIAHYYLGHLNDEDSFDICFRDYKSSKGSDFREIDANRFASTLLMPKEIVITLFNLGLEVDDMAKRFKVSREAMSYRLKGLKLIR